MGPTARTVGVGASCLGPSTLVAKGGDPMSRDDVFKLTALSTSAG